jgi:DNA polymerase III epsilon subunit-like protein
MKYYLDTEFIEGTQTKLFGKEKPTIDLISIGLVCEDDRKYYAISKNFNIKEAWNRFQIEKSGTNAGLIETKVYWIRDNVLKPIWLELYLKEHNIIISDPILNNIRIDTYFSIKNLKYLINKYGKTNKEIAEEIKEFTYCNLKYQDYVINNNIQIYGYYSAYDWVVFCFLFGKMIDLPSAFPKYCIDLKPILDNKVNKLETYQLSNIVFPNGDKGFTNDKDGILSVKLDRIKECPNYPKQTNEHNALDDATWNKKLHDFLISL